MRFERRRGDIAECLADIIESQCSYAYSSHDILHIHLIEEKVQHKASLEPKDDLPSASLSEVQTLIKSLKTRKAQGLDGLLPFVEKASRRVNVSEFAGCTVAIDSYCWLHKGAFACADKLVRGDETDVHIKYCLKYVGMLISKNVKPILVFDGQHLPAKAMTEAKRRESRDTSKKRAAELLSLGRTDEARSYMRRSVDITHAMALNLIQECRKRNVDCIVAPYEADAQLAYLNLKNIAQVVITEDSDLILFGCSKILFKMDLDGTGTLVETAKLPLVMKCPIERYSFDKFRQMCILSGCDYLSSLPGIGLAKARMFVTATVDPNFANALKKLPSFFNKTQLNVTDEYIENFLKAEATFKHQYVFDPITRQLVRLTEPDDEDVEIALCSNGGEKIDPKIAFQLALGNLDPFSLKKMDDWHPDKNAMASITIGNVKSDGWKKSGISPYPSIWNSEFKNHLTEGFPWQKKVIKKLDPILSTCTVRPVKKVINLVSKYVPETQDVGGTLSIESLRQMYCVQESPTKKQKKDNVEIPSSSTCINSKNLYTTNIQGSQETLNSHDVAYSEDKINEDLTEQSQPQQKSPILQSKIRVNRDTFKKSTYSILKRLSKFPRTVLDDNLVESKFFSSSESIGTENDTQSTEVSLEVDNCHILNDSINKSNTNKSKESVNRNPFKIKSEEDLNTRLSSQGAIEDMLTEDISSSQKENSCSSITVKLDDVTDVTADLCLKRRLSEDLDISKNESMNEDLFVENTYPMENLITPVPSQSSFGTSQLSQLSDGWKSTSNHSNENIVKPAATSCNRNSFTKAKCRVPGLRKTVSSNQPTLLSKFGFEKSEVTGTHVRSQPWRSHKRIVGLFERNRIFDKGEWADKGRSGLIEGSGLKEEEAKRQNFYSLENATSNSRSCFFTSIFCGILRNIGLSPLI
ncbi:Exonuclease 1 [Eumeta japonica]|uniref:Exonuclease 1 n=1 Tax=Eumeta variegata TaxID=151549 RepID=A0A4C1V2N5_EUMVA|nr:Exonuclease 1 [Eumeta japonica]